MPRPPNPAGASFFVIDPTRPFPAFPPIARKLKSHSINYVSQRSHTEAVGSLAQMRSVSFWYFVYRVMAKSTSRIPRIIQTLMRIVGTLWRAHVFPKPSPHLTNDSPEEIALGQRNIGHSSPTKRSDGVAESKLARKNTKRRCVRRSGWVKRSARKLTPRHN
jgi:hypothetical protein